MLEGLRDIVIVTGAYLLAVVDNVSQLQRLKAVKMYVSEVCSRCVKIFYRDFKIGFMDFAAWSRPVTP